MHAALTKIECFYWENVRRLPVTAFPVLEGRKFSKGLIRLKVRTVIECRGAWIAGRGKPGKIAGSRHPEAWAPCFGAGRPAPQRNFALPHESFNTANQAGAAGPRIM